jgi:cytochrome c5
LTLGVLIATSFDPPRAASARPAAGAAARPYRFVRGYIATRVGGGDDKVSKLARLRPHDVFLPGVKTFLRDLATGADGEAVRTDLSGRFTLPAPGPGRYRVCWKAPGFIDDCAQDIFSVGNDHLHVGTLRIAPDRKQGTTVVFGQVRMKDGSPARLLEPFANVNAFARVSLLDKGGKVLHEAYVNNFGDYLLPQVPVKQAITLRARIEGATQDQRLLPEANLQGAPFHPIDLVIGNTPPRLEPVVAADAAGKRVKKAKPGATVRLAARASDPDGDPVRYRWLVADGSGTLSAIDTPQVAWTLPNYPGRFSATLLAYDGKGGYAQSTLSLRADDRGILFSGKVDATDAPALAGAEVEVNGQTTMTGAEGFFQIDVKDAARFVLNIRKPGYALVSRVYDDGLTGGRWTMTRATVMTLDPTKDQEIVNQREARDCPGRPSGRLNWKDYGPLAQPQWQDGKGNVVAPFAKLEVPLPSPGRREQECGPGIRVKIPANALHDARGVAPPGNVQVMVSTIDLMSPEQMPGDYTVKVPGPGTQVMQSYGAGTIEIRAGNVRYNLKPGAKAEVTIPVDPSQLAAGGPLPPTIPLLSYNERDGVWVQEGVATLKGKAYVGTVTHFSAFNTDTLKVNQSCVRVLSPTLPPTYNLEVTIPMGPGAAPKVITKLIDNSPPSEHVIYNLPSNVNIVLVPIRLTDNTPIGTFVVNTGGHQNPTSPNLPAGPPYVACSTQVTLTDLAVPPLPTPGLEFLHGLYSFAATNLDELQDSDPTQHALKQALDQATANYYKQIDPPDPTNPKFKNGRRFTLDDFKTTNVFGGPGELRAIYANSGDLGFGRDMHCVRNGANVAAYVTNYGDITTPDTADVAAAIAGTNPVATVAMEYSPIEGDPTPTPVVKFYVYNAAGTRVNSADLDQPAPGHGHRPVPQLCMVCHGGEYPGGSVPTGAPPFNNRDDTKLGSQFIPFDLRFYTFGPAPYDKASQQAVFKSLNQDIVMNAGPNPAVAEIITKMYAGGPTQDENFVATGWNAQPPQQAMYTNVVAHTCRSCHATNSFPAIRFDQASQMIDTRLGTIESRVCVQHVMPHSKRTHELFWTSVGPHMPAQLQVFGDTYKSGLNGWDGTLCGHFTPGGPTPASVYTTTVQPIFNTNCTVCHNGGSPPAGLNLSASASYANLVNIPSTELPGMNRVKPNDSAHSYLFHKIAGTAGMVGGNPSQMPLGSPPLSSTDQNAIKNWIDTGAAP